MDHGTKESRAALPFEARSPLGPRLPRRFDPRWSRRPPIRPQSSLRYRRSEVRKSLRLPIEVVHPDWETPEVWTTSDLSPTGAWVRTEREAAPGDAIIVSFRLPHGSRELSFFAEVIRVLWEYRDDELVPSGFAVRFLDAGPLDRLRIREALRGIPPRVPAASRRTSAA
jgi:hypothetical protein